MLTANGSYIIKTNVMIRTLPIIKQSLVNSKCICSMGYMHA